MFPFKPSTLEERKEFYKNQFNTKKLDKWFAIKPSFYAVDLGTETKIIKDPKKINKLFIFKRNNLKKQLINFLPEDVYYDRNIYKNNKICSHCLKTRFKHALSCKNILGQELVFDIDALNIKCSCKDKLCSKCLNESIKQAFKLKKQLDFKKVKVVFSGRGCHVHVVDKKTYKLKEKERKEIINNLKNFPIDPWVSTGEIRFVRLPYSLNALVSRITTPINNKFNIKRNKKIIPDFLKH